MPQTAQIARLRNPAIVLAIGLLVAALRLVGNSWIDGAISLLAAPAVATLMVRAALRAERPARSVWTLLAAHILLIAAGDITDFVLQLAGVDPQVASVTDVLYLASSIPLVVAIGRIAALASRARFQDVLVDAAAVAVVAGLAIWQVLIVGPAALSTGSLIERSINGAYPSADILVVGALVALIFARTRLTPIVGFLSLYGAINLLIDLTALWGNVNPGAPGWMLSTTQAAYAIAYALLGAAAVTGDPLEMHERPERESGSVPRLTLLGIAVLSAPALAVILTTGHQPVWVPLLVGAALAVSVLVMIRVGGLVRRLEVEQRRLSATEAHLAFQASHDALTGLPNRALLTDRLADEVARAHAEHREIALMFIDLDDFKMVNDTLGHAAGDELLRVVARRIYDQIAPGDFIGRVGGDEFVVVSPNLVDRRSASRFADSVLAAVCEPIPIDRQIIEPSASIGVALRGSSDNPQTLLANADLALYKAKDSGRSCARMFDQSLRLAATERAGIEHGLRRAVGQREMTVEYQPRINLTDGRLSSLEALARWPHRPDVAVSRFIAVAEETGIVEQLGREVLNLACRDLMRINDAGAATTPIGVSVNVSMRQLMQRDLVDIVADAIQRHSVPPRLLTLEITETFVAQEPEMAARTLTELHHLGVRIEIDDFGVGHTSFRSLSNLAIDGIKIDRSLVLGLGTHEATESIISAIIAMAHALDLQTTVEGIETAAELAIIRSLGCDLGQGYLFSRPASLERIEQLAATWPQLCPAAAELAVAAGARPRLS